MKLRIKGNSLRFRLLQSEVADLDSTGRIEEHISFGLADRDNGLSYAIEHSDGFSSMHVEYAGNAIRLRLPSRQIKDWAEQKTVGLYSEQKLFGGEMLILMLEKDFACLDLSDAENLDTFPNPNSIC